MINSAYAKAYTEVMEIIKYFPEEEYKKIPSDKIEFYKGNMDKNYAFEINPEIDLSKQNISKEAKAVLVILYRDFFASEKQKELIEEILVLNHQKDEQEKSMKYNPDDIFKNKNTTVNTNNTELVQYKENFFEKFKKFVYKIIKK